MAFIEIASKLIKGVVKVGQKVGGVAVEAIKKGVAKRKEKKAAKKGLDPVASTASELVDGSAKYYRELLNQQKDKMRDEATKIRFANKLINAGMSEAEARAKVGLSAVSKFSTAAWLGTVEEEPSPEINFGQTKVTTAARQGCAWLTLIILSGGGALVGGLIFLAIKIF